MLSLDTVFFYTEDASNRSPAVQAKFFTYSYDLKTLFFGTNRNRTDLQTVRTDLSGKKADLAALGVQCVMDDNSLFLVSPSPIAKGAADT